MTALELIEVGDTTFYAEVMGGGGPETVGLSDALSFEGVRNAIHAIASELEQVWTTVRPTEASAEFKISLTAKSGALLGVLVQGEGDSSITVKLVWKA